VVITFAALRLARLRFGKNIRHFSAGSMELEANLKAITGLSHKMLPFTEATRYSSIQPTESSKLLAPA